MNKIKDTNYRKSEQLGMPHGTANAKLRKLILFNLVKKCNEDICFKCGLKIENVEELSIEHKEPWYQRDTDLFWDLDNIAFSHLKCNRPHGFISEDGMKNLQLNGINRRKSKINGMSWCIIGQHEVNNDEFSKNITTWNGLEFNCKVCRSKYRNKKYKKK